MGKVQGATISYIVFIIYKDQEIISQAIYFLAGIFERAT